MAKTKIHYQFELYRKGVLVGLETHAEDPDLKRAGAGIAIYHKTKTETQYKIGWPVTTGDAHWVFHDEKRMVYPLSTPTLPRHPVLHEDRKNKEYWFECPACHHNLAISCSKFCWNCGIALEDVTKEQTQMETKKRSRKTNEML